MSLKKNFFIYLLLILILSILFGKTNNIIFLILAITVIAIPVIFKKWQIGLISILMVLVVYMATKSVVPTIDRNEFIVQVYESHEKYYFVKDEFCSYLLYKDDNEYKVGNKLKIIGSAKEISIQTVPNVFSFKDYLTNLNIYYYIDYSEIIVDDNRVSLITFFRENMLSNLDDKTKSFVKMFVFNERTVDIESIYNNLQTLSALHLFAISGFHINLLIGIIVMIVKKATKNKAIIEILPVVLIFPYLCLLSFSVASTRAFLTIIFKKVNKYKDLKFTSLNIIALTGIIILCLDYTAIFSLSFVFSYILVVFIELSQKKLKKQHFLLKPISLSIICFFAAAPIILTVNYELNLLSFITNLLLTPIMSIGYIISILTVIIHPLSEISRHFYPVLERFIEITSKINIMIIFGKPKVEYILIYYLLFVVWLELVSKAKVDIKKLKLLTLPTVVVIAFICRENYFNWKYRVIFLDVKQGDCSLIISRNSYQAILIDTGGLNYMDLATTRIIPLLKSYGISTVKAVVASHNDYDHIGALESLKTNFKVEREIYNTNNISTINTFHNQYINLNRWEWDNENDNSIVLLTNINGKRFLFTGDISARVEEKIIEENPNLDIDILKVAHHGSKYSTSEKLITTITPEYAVISCGKNNLYGHPHAETIKVLEKSNVKILRTDINGSIIFNY